MGKLIQYKKEMRKSDTKEEGEVGERKSP